MFQTVIVQAVVYRRCNMWFQYRFLSKLFSKQDSLFSLCTFLKWNGLDQHQWYKISFMMHQNNEPMTPFCLRVQLAPFNKPWFWWSQIIDPELDQRTHPWIYIYPLKKKNYKFFENDFLGVFEKRSIKKQIYNRWSWVNKTFAYNQTIPNPPTLPILKHM